MDSISDRQRQPNGTEPKQNRPLNVIIVGAGIGGLTAAIFLRQQGHQVTLLEQSRFTNELGAAVHLAPNANGLLRRIGLIPESLGAVNAEQLSQWHPDGKVMFSIPLKNEAGRWQHPWQLAHRALLHKELKRLATCEEGKGRPAILKTRSKVADVDPAQGTVTLEDGEVFKGDVMVGADGVHSATRKRIPGADQIKTFSSGKSAFRFLVPRKKVLADPETRKFADLDGHLLLIFGKDRRVVLYPTNDNKLLNFFNIHPTSESQVQEENLDSSDWQSQGKLSKMLEIYKQFEPAVLNLLAMADEETLKVWELLDMEQLPTWTHKRLVLIGDAAHPFTPHQGQGAAQAIEDAASLAVMLPNGTSTDESSILARLKLYEKCRYERASRIQEVSRIAGKDLGTGPPLDSSRFTAYNFGHDEWDYSSQVLRKWEWEQNPGLIWRMPTPFGPMPGPRQDHYGRLRDGSQARFATTSMKFKSSRTVLQNLFPTPEYKFAVDDTIVYATFAVTQLSNLEWLGGRGYNHFGLYIHGVQYTNKDGEITNGTYLPVLFENLADPIISGREELGFPKLFADLNFQMNGEELKLDCSWMGSKFGSFSFSGLREAPVTNGTALEYAPSKSTQTPNAPAPPPPPQETGMFFHKYIPATGSLGSTNVDVEYEAFLPSNEDSKTVERRIESTLEATSTSVEFDALDWKALPTLHHIIDRLQEIPVYEVTEAKVVKGTGVSDVRSVQKLFKSEVS